MAANRQRATISVVMIVKDEADVLDACLSSVSWADEIVVYDTGSTDTTRDVARRYTDTVIDGYWDDDFGAARNRALAHATGDWVLSIDADEVFESQGATLRKHLAKASVGTFGLRILNQPRTSLDEPYEFTANRIFRRRGHRWGDRLHEQIYTTDGRPTAGPVLAGIRLLHSGYADAQTLATTKAARNIAIVEAQLTEALAADDERAVAVARAHLARSLILAAHWDRSQEVAEEAWAPGTLPTLVAEALVLGQSALALMRGQLPVAQVWVDRWREIDPTGARVDIAQARLSEKVGDVDRALAALGRVPTVSQDLAGGVLRRDSVADLEVRLLARAGREADAVKVAAAALRAGSRVLNPVDLAVQLGGPALDELLAVITADQRRAWALRCGQVANATALGVLEAMVARWPDDPAVLVAAARVVPTAGTFEDAVEWSARLRRLGLDEYCTLVAFAAEQGQAPRDRALAAALAFSAYHDGRALASLDEALDRVPTQRMPELVAQLEIVAPGLVAMD